MLEAGRFALAGLAFGLAMRFMPLALAAMFAPRSLLLFARKIARLQEKA